MNKLLLVLFFFFPLSSFGQKDTTKWVRGFPITDYMPDIGDSVKVVQIKLDGGTKLVEKQIGLLKGIYRDKHADTATIGTGRCNLIKGDYYYFTINYKQSGKLPRAGDLLYTLVDKTPIYYGNIARLASQFIGLKNVYDISFYDCYIIFSNWSMSNEEVLLDSMVADIHFGGNYFLNNNPSMNVKIEKGKYKDKMVLNTMIACGKGDVTDFLEYMIARPRLYAGIEWKLCEVFATWLVSGAPTVVKN
ncbi:MAG TPA: hypothetical protein VK483_00570 [Chitinophagaceae bacterium]|nr:hypothetical protein [Chitinophagaceae bacterium]